MVLRDALCPGEDRGFNLRIGLYNLEPKINNLALEKIRLYYEARGDIVESYFALKQYDEVWASSIFDYTPKETVVPGMRVGGTGFDLTTVLPPEIDRMRPKLNYGFTSRGCPRRCKFCVVPKKEGRVRVECDLYDLWDGRAKDITLFDNNILALPEHFEEICHQAKTNKIRLDFNQGLDHRLLTKRAVELLKTTSTKDYRFSFDNARMVNSVERAIELLEEGGVGRCFWYVLVGFNSTFEEDLFRLNYLRGRNHRAYVMRYKDGEKPDPRLAMLARWANQQNMFYGKTWEQFINIPKNQHIRKWLINKEEE